MIKYLVVKKKVLYYIYNYYYFGINRIQTRNITVKKDQDRLTKSQNIKLVMSIL